MSIDLSELRDDGDTIELESGATLRLRVHPDDMTAMDDGDWYGAVALVEWDRYNERIKPRPNGITGNAEKLYFGRGEVVWWEPPGDVKRGTPGFTSLRSALLDVLEYGYVVVTLELCEGVNAYRQPIVRNVASVGGVEAMARPDYMTEIVSELAAELGINTEETER